MTAIKRGPKDLARPESVMVVTAGGVIISPISSFASPVTLGSIVTLLSDVVVSAATGVIIIVIVIIIEQTTRARARHTMRAFILELNTLEKSVGKERMG